MCRPLSPGLFSKRELGTCYKPSSAGCWCSGREQPASSGSLLRSPSPATLAAFWSPAAGHLGDLPFLSLVLELFALPLHQGIFLSPFAQETPFLWVPVALIFWDDHLPN